MTDWSTYRKCPVCFSALGTACKKLTGVEVEHGSGVPIWGDVDRDRPHSRRKLRTGPVSR